MRPDARAIVFDLDDTLYPYRSFVRSGFNAIARRLSRDLGLRPSSVLRVLVAAGRRGGIGSELQTLCSRVGLSASHVPALLDVLREHTPALRLPSESRCVLESIRRRWRIGILTNGAPQIQRRKIAALGVADLVDTVVLAAECGDGSGKPAPEGFCEVLDRLSVGPCEAVFVGDDCQTDMRGASSVGMSTIHVLARPTRNRCSWGRCDIHVAHLRQVPAAANRLVPLKARSYAV